MVWLLLFALIFAPIFFLNKISYFRNHLEITGSISGVILFSIIYLSGMNDPFGGSIIAFNLLTLMIPALIAGMIDSTGRLDIPFIFAGAFIEFLLLGYMIGTFMKVSKNKKK